MDLPGKKRTMSLDARFEKEPAVQPRYPPSSGIEYKVSSGESWKSIAKKNGIPVWELIKFNCHSTNPAEVNWWLRNVLGCDTCTADEKNWTFGDASNIRPIFLPPPASLKMKPDALAREVDFVIQQGNSKLGVLTLKGLCSDLASPLSEGAANYYQLAVPVGERLNALTMRVFGWSYTLTYDFINGGIPAYTLRTMKGGGFMMDLAYPLYARNVHHAKGSITVVTGVSYDKVSPIPELRPKKEPAGIKSFATFNWVATVTAWSTAPPANFILPD